jgi:predicted ATPase
MHASRLPAEPALTGRDQEIRQLEQHLYSVLDGKGTTVFIYGEAGVGKTKLVNEFLNFAKKRGTKIFSGWCLSEANIPYFPFREAFSTYVPTISDEKAKSAMTKHLGITGWLKSAEPAQEFKAREIFSTPEIERDKTFEVASRVIFQLSAQEPVILFLDDLHWADHLSLALLHYLSRKCKNSRLLIIGTYRPEELTRTQEEKLHPLEETMFSMSREDLLSKMELKRLKRNDFPKLLRSIFRSSLDEKFEAKVYEETEGNPLFAIETLNMLVDEGYLSEKEGRWVLTVQAEKIGIPSKVHEVITRRISRLGREKRKLLDLAAVCGDSFTPDILSRAFALDIADVLDTLVELEQRHRLIRSANSAFEFTHHKIREVIYANLPRELRRIYHLKTASSLEQVLTEKISDSYMADMAIHYVEGGTPEKAFEYILRLGEKAVNVYANVQAIEYLSKALEVTQKNVSLATNENLFKIYKLRGEAWLRQDEKTKAMNDFNLMLQNATNISDESMIAEAHYWLGNAHEPYFGEMDETMRHFTTAIEMARKTGNKPLEGRSLRGLGGALMWGATLDTMDEGRMRLEESSKICKEIGDKVTEADNLHSLGLYYNWKGEFNRAKEDLNKALALAEEVGAIPSIIFKLFVLSMVLAGNGQYNDAISTGQRCIQLARDSGLVSEVSMVLNVLGWIYHDLSNIEIALKYNNESIEIARAHQKEFAYGGVPFALLNLGMDYLYKNDYENAEKCFKEVSSMYHQHPYGWWRVEAHILLGRGEIALAKGDYTRALKFAEDLLVISEEADAKKYIAKGLKLKAEVLAKMGKIDEAIELMKNAWNLAQQVGNPPLLWQIHYSYGLLLEKHGDPKNANEHYAQAIALIEAVASELNDAIIKSTLLTSPKTRAIRDAYARSVSVQEKAVDLERSKHAHIQAFLNVPSEVTVGEMFEIRLDMTNVAKEPGLLVRIESLVASNFKLTKIVPKYKLKDGSIDLKGKHLEPKKVESIKVWATASESGVIHLSPRIVYVDELGKFKICQPDPATVAIYPPGKFQFKTNNAQKVFEFLTKAFVEDYMRRRLTLEKSGWRTLMQIVRKAKISKSSVYGTRTRRGRAISELQRRGIIEMRIFTEERGRGGKITKIRIAYEKDIVKRHIDQRVMKIKEK